MGIRIWAGVLLLGISVFARANNGPGPKYQFWKNRGCNAERSAAVAAAHENACDRISQAYSRMLYHRDAYALEKEFSRRSYFNVIYEPGNWDFYLGVLRKSYGACLKRNAIAYQCEAACPAESEREAFVNFYFVPRNPIHLCPLFFDRQPQQSDQASLTLSHEFGRLFGGIGGDEGMNRSDIYVWDAILNRLVADYGAS